MRIYSVIGIGVAILPFTPGGKAYWSDYLAARHVKKLTPVLQRDGRFNHVILESDFGMGGAIVLRGKVDKDEDILALKKITADSNPPVKVWCFVRTPVDSHRPLDQ